MVRGEPLPTGMVASAPQVKVGIHLGKAIGSKLVIEVDRAFLVRNLLHGADIEHVHKLAIGVIIFSAPITPMFPTTPPTRVHCLTFNPRKEHYQCKPLG